MRVPVIPASNGLTGAQQKRPLRRDPGATRWLGGAGGQSGLRLLVEEANLNVFRARERHVEAVSEWVAAR